MKAGWRQVPLGDVAEVIAGQSPEGRFYNTTGDGSPFYQGKKDFGDKYLEPPTTWTTQRTKMATEGDVLMSVRAPVGPVNFATQDVCIGRGLAAIRSRGGIDREFLFYQLLSLQDSLAGKDGAVFPSINRAAIEAVPLVVPPLPEQRRIVALLDEAFEGIAKARANAEKNIENARAVFESYREDALAPKGGWLSSPLGDLCTIKHGFAFKGEFFTDAGDFVLLTPGSFFERGGYRERGEKTKYYVGEIPPEYVLKAGDMLTAMTEQAAGLLGSPLIVPESNRFLHNQRLGLFEPLPGKPWVTKFFFHVMNLARVRKEIHDGGTGAKVRHTSPGRIRAVAISYPCDAEEQARVASRIDEVHAESERLEDVSSRKLAALDEFKKSLLHHAFAGEL